MAPQRNPPLDAGSRNGRAPVRTLSLATTFGIKFECVLAFHESELSRVLEEDFIVASVQKDLLREEHTALLGGRENDSLRRSHFPSWGLYVPTDDLAIDKMPVGSYGRLRSYFMEPLLIAQNALRTGQCPTNVIGLAAPKSPVLHSGPHSKIIVLRDKGIDYEQWTLTCDSSVPGATELELYEKA